MLKRILSITLSGMLLSAAFGLHAVRAQALKATETSDMMRAKVQKIGVGRDARVEVKLRDNTKLKGYITASDQDNFTVTDTKTGVAQTVPFADVTQVKKSGGGLSTRAWVIIGAAAAATVIVGLTVIKPVVCDGGAGC